MESEIYEVLPGFSNSRHVGPDYNHNGWNEQLESWLIDVQKEANTYYIMLIETSTKIAFWKWFFIISSCILAASSVAIVSVTSGLSIQAIWIAIYVTCVSTITTALFTLYEALGFNEWIQDCKTVAGDYLKIGTKIETQKRFPRHERLACVDFVNECNSVFGELKQKCPSILARVKKKHAIDFGTRNKGMMTREKSVELFSDNNLQDKFEEKLKLSNSQKIEENDELLKYEDYIRKQYVEADLRWLTRANTVFLNK